MMTLSPITIRSNGFSSTLSGIVLSLLGAAPADLCVVTLMRSESRGSARSVRKERRRGLPAVSIIYALRTAP
jgi:hypothetical protein